MTRDNFSIFSVLVDSARQRPERPAIIDQDGILDYATLLAEVEKVAQVLKAQGLQEGDSVGVQGRNSRGFIISVFAAVRCGATVLPIAHTLMQAERDEIIDRTSLHVLISDAPCEEYFSTPEKEVAIPGAPLFFYYETGKPHDRRIMDRVGDAAFVRYTSGTTGQTKGVVLAHHRVYERIQAANKGLQLNEDDVVLFVLPMAFHFYVSIILYLYVGAAIVIARDHSPGAIADLIERNSVTLFYASPYHYRMLSTSHVAREKIQTLRYAISTSTGLSQDIAEKFQATFALPITQAYGIIEVGLPIINIRDNNANPRSIGTALPDYEVAILDDNGHELDRGKKGQLAVKGPGMFSAYLDPFRTREEVLVNGWFMTGDVAVQDEDGSITIQGREKSMINVCGEKVFPEEIEHVLASHKHVTEAYVFGAAHPRLGETVHAQVVLSGHAPVTSEELIGFARKRLSPLKIPQQIFFVDQIEKTASGKAYRRSH